jgi:hypothetical protein
VTHWPPLTRPRCYWRVRPVHCRWSATPPRTCGRAGQEDPVEAARHARIALEGRQPLELDTMVALLEILSDSLDQEIALDAATALVELRRELVERYPDSPTALRDLSISLDNVAGIQQ